MFDTIKQLTLDEVKSSFEQWRALRKRGARIPDELWQQIRKLDHQAYKPSRIYNTLGISGSQYKKHVAQQDLSSTFVEVSANIQADQPHLSAYRSITERKARIEIQRHDGALLSITNLDHDIISHVIQNFLR
jgi:hypothetical protein